MCKYGILCTLVLMSMISFSEASEVGRYQIFVHGDSVAMVFRLDTKTGKIVRCPVDYGWLIDPPHAPNEMDDKCPQFKIIDEEKK
jgi:hypothetical protein